MILVLVIGFNRLKEPTTSAAHIHSISIVIPIRDEAHNIPALLSSLANIQYPHFEIILVDDHSSDNPQLAAHNPQLVRLIHSPGHGKKSAISHAIQNSTRDIIVTTDADCCVTPQWLEKINAAFQDARIQMMIGGVRIEEDQTLFSRLQSLEFVSVAVTGAATLGLGFPTMCNGANLSYRRSAFLQVDGYSGNEKISSGDDEFLLNKINHTSKGSIGYLCSSASLVTSSPLPLVTSFLSQRFRWAGKWSSNISLTTRLFALVVWLFHLSFILMAFSPVFGFISWNLFAILAGAKVFVEALLLIPAAKFYQVKWRWISFLVLQFVYSFYVITIGFMSQTFSPKWKGRTVAAKV
ncbi:MAG TPA: glycosyltransferase [Cyclobacteriaceae bacterium]